MAREQLGTAPVEDVDTVTKGWVEGRLFAVGAFGGVCDGVTDDTAAWADALWGDVPLASDQPAQDLFGLL